MSNIYILILAWFIVTGWREGYTWALPDRQYELDKQFFDYHAMRMIEGIIIFLLCIFAVNGLSENMVNLIIIINIFGFWLIGNWVYEKVLRHTLNFSLHGNETTFRICNLDLWYRWWLYELGAIIGLVIIIIS